MRPFDLLLPVKGFLKKVGDLYKPAIGPNKELRPWVSVEGTGVTVEDVPSFKDPLTGETVGMTKITVPAGGGGTPYDGTPADLVSAEAGPGDSNSYARGNHTHAHGNLSGGSLHAAADGSAPGFLSTAFWTLLNAATNAATASTLAKRDSNGDLALRRLTLADQLNTGSTFTETVGAAARAVTTSSGNRTETYSGTLEIHAGNSVGGQAGEGRVRINAQSDGTHVDYDYNGTVGVGHKINPAGECDVEVASGATAYRILKGGVQRLKITADGLAGGRATASGAGSFAFADVLSVADGPASILGGYDNTAENTYCVNFGAYNRCRGTACVTLGETLENASTSANCSQVGFSSIIYGNSPYAGTFGSSCYVEANCPGGLAVGGGATVTRPGQYRRASGNVTFNGGTNQLDVNCVVDGVAGNLVDRAGGEFYPEQYSVAQMTLRMQIATTNGAKRAYVTLRICVMSLVGDIEIDSVTEVHYEGMDENGWAYAVTEETGGKLRIHVDPGSDSVAVVATWDWNQLGGTSSIAA